MKQIYSFFLILFFLSSACKEEQSVTEADYLSQMAAVEAEILSIITTACTEQGQCKSAAIGAKPCGGPTHFLIYSGVTTSEEQLQELISEYNQLNRAYNEASGIGSDCAVETPPDIGCVDGNCSAL